MSVTVEQVPMWLVLGGKGHAIACTRSGWHYCACGTLTPNGDPTKEKPDRICSKCRARLKDASLKAEQGTGSK